MKILILVWILLGLFDLILFTLGDEYYVFHKELEADMEVNGYVMYFITWLIVVIVEIMLGPIALILTIKSKWSN